MPDEKIVKEFPCNNCGSTDRFMKQVVAKEQEKGLIPKDVTGAIEVIIMPAINPKPVIPYIPGMVKPCGTAYFDICMRCGKKYCFMVIESEGVLTSIPGMPRGHP